MFPRRMLHMKQTCSLSSIAVHVAAGFLLTIATIPFAAGQARPFSTAPSKAQGQFDQDTIGYLHIGSNVNVTNKSGAQSETSVAVDPTNRMHILESVNDLTNTATVYES